MKASNFKLPSTSKDNYSLKDSIGKYVVLYFYPKDDTPGCTIETNDFNKLLFKFKKLDCRLTKFKVWFFFKWITNYIFLKFKKKIFFFFYNI